MDLINIEKNWEKSKIRLTPRELLDIFPEAKEIIKNNLKKMQHISEILLLKLRRELDILKIQYGAGNEWFAQEIVKFSSTYDAMEEIDRLIWELKKFPLENKTDNKKRRFEDLLTKARRVSIEHIATPHLKRIKRYGNRISAQCPFHNDRNPSLCLYTATNTWHCFGGCGSGGDVIDFVIKIYGYSFKEAVNYLANY